MSTAESLIAGEKEEEDGNRLILRELQEISRSLRMITNPRPAPIRSVTYAGNRGRLLKSDVLDSFKVSDQPLPETPLMRSLKHITELWDNSRGIGEKNLVHFLKQLIRERSPYEKRASYSSRPEPPIAVMVLNNFGDSQERIETDIYRSGMDLKFEVFEQVWRHVNAQWPKSMGGRMVAPTRDPMSMQGALPARSGPLNPDQFIEKCEQYNAIFCLSHPATADDELCWRPASRDLKNLQVCYFTLRHQEDGVRLLVSDWSRFERMPVYVNSRYFFPEVPERRWTVFPRKVPTCWNHISPHMDDNVRAPLRKDVNLGRIW